jgi:hypothetical protein
MTLLKVVLRPDLAGKCCSAKSIFKCAVHWPIS